MIRRKAEIKKTAQYLYEREAKGLPLPPTMQRGTKEYVKSKYWNTLNQRAGDISRKKVTKKNSSYFLKGISIEMTKTEFSEWVEKKWEDFQRLYSEGKTPSIDRIDNSKNYAPNNMQVVSLKENMRKDRIKAVICTNILTKKTKIYSSAKDAESDGFNAKLISRAILNGMNHKQCSWRFL